MHDVQIRIGLLETIQIHRLELPDIVHIGLFGKGIGFVIFLGALGNSSKRDLFRTLGLLDDKGHSVVCRDFSSPFPEALGHKGCIQDEAVPLSGKIVPIGESGELCTRGYSVMVGYWDNIEATQMAIDSAGWMHSGDLARMDEDGYVNIVGRIKDMIIRGGENIYPREIEEFLYQQFLLLWINNYVVRLRIAPLM